MNDSVCFAFFSYLIRGESEQDSPCATLIRFCLIVPRAKLAKSKFRIVCQK